MDTNQECLFWDDNVLNKQKLSMVQRLLWLLIIMVYHYDYVCIAVSGSGGDSCTGQPNEQLYKTFTMFMA